MKSISMALLVAACICGVVRAEDWTVDGKDFHGVKVTQAEPDRVHITYDGGVGTVNLADLAPDLQKRFNYDPVAAKEYARQRDASQASSIADEQARARTEAAVQAQAAAKVAAAKAIEDAKKKQAAYEAKLYYQQELNQQQAGEPNHAYDNDHGLGDH